MSVLEQDVSTFSFTRGRDWKKINLYFNLEHWHILLDYYIYNLRITPAYYDLYIESFLNMDSLIPELCTSF